MSKFLDDIGLARILANLKSNFALKTDIPTVPVTSVNTQTGDVVIPNATTSVDGLMSSTDKDALNGLKVNPVIPYGVCDTAANVTPKVVTVSPAITLTEGQLILVKFTNKNEVTDAYLNVNSLGAKKIYIESTTGVFDLQAYSWSAGQTMLFRYDGTGWTKLTQAIIPRAVKPGLMTQAEKDALDSLSTQGIIVVSFIYSGSMVTITNSAITSNHVVLSSEIYYPQAQNADWTVTTYDGYLTMSGFASWATGVKLVLGKVGTTIS